MLNYKQLRQTYAAKNGTKRADLPRVAPIIAFLALATIFLLVMAGCAYASEQVDVYRLANAIYIAEGGAKTAHPYGILKHYKHTSARSACINTIRHALLDWSEDMRVDFITFLARRYAPIGAANDPTGLNKNWIKNVRYYYERG